MAGLELRGVSKSYGGGPSAVHEASLTIGDGEFVVLVGPSGCGKSTVLRMVAGLERVSAGEVLIDGARVNDREPGERDIAMVFQSYALYPHMSVRDNMAYGLRNQGMKKPEIARRIDVAAEILQLGEFLDRKPRQLSGGQRQRVAMGRAIVREPKAFLLDEPLSNLDAKLRTHMRGELKRLHDRLKATFIYVTHDQIEAMALADRIVVMNGGRIEQIGAPREVYAAPASRFVAEFIGAPKMNILPGDAVGREEAWIGVRPEHLTLIEGPAPAEGLILDGEVTLVEDLGADNMIHFTLPEAEAAGPLIARAPAGVRPAPGARPRLHAAGAHLHRFDADERAATPNTREDGREEAAKGFG